MKKLLLTTVLTLGLSVAGGGVGYAVTNNYKQADIKNLNTKIEQVETVNAENEEKIGSLTNENITLANKNNQKDNENKTLLESVKEKQSKIDELQEKVKLNETEITQIKSSQAEDKSKISELETENENLQNEIVSLQEQLNSLVLDKVEVPLNVVNSLTFVDVINDNELLFEANNNLYICNINLKTLESFYSNCPSLFKKFGNYIAFYDGKYEIESLIFNLETKNVRQLESFIVKQVIDDNSILVTKNLNDSISSYIYDYERNVYKLIDSGTVTDLIVLKDGVVVFKKDGSLYKGILEDDSIISSSLKCFGTYGYTLEYTADYTDGVLFTYRYLSFNDDCLYSFEKFKNTKDYILLWKKEDSTYTYKILNISTGSIVISSSSENDIGAGSGSTFILTSEKTFYVPWSGKLYNLESDELQSVDYSNFPVDYYLELPNGNCVTYSYPSSASGGKGLGLLDFNTGSFSTISGSENINWSKCIASDDEGYYFSTSQSREGNKLGYYNVNTGTFSLLVSDGVGNQWVALKLDNGSILFVDCTQYTTTNSKVYLKSADGNFTLVSDDIPASYTKLLKISETKYYLFSTAPFTSAIYDCELNTLTDLGTVSYNGQSYCIKYAEVIDEEVYVVGVEKNNANPCIVGTLSPETGEITVLFGPFSYSGSLSLSIKKLNGTYTLFEILNGYGNVWNRYLYNWESSECLTISYNFEDLGNGVYQFKIRHDGTRFTTIQFDVNENKFYYIF